MEEIKVLRSNDNFWELIWSNQGLNCINIEVWRPNRDLIEEIRNQGPNYQKVKFFCIVLVLGITNLYVKYIPDIKNVFSFDDIEQLGFYPIR